MAYYWLFFYCNGVCLCHWMCQVFLRSCCMHYIIWKRATNWRFMAEFAKVWLALCGTTWENPCLVYVEGHSTHLTRRFMETVAKHFIYIIVEPRHISMFLQVADVGVNRFIKTEYSSEYNSSICAHSVIYRAFDGTERVDVFCEQ